MQYQEEKGIYVYFIRDNYENGSASSEITFVRYETLEHFFWLYHEDSIKNDIGYSVYDHKCTEIVDYEYGRGYRGQRYIRTYIQCEKVNCTKHNTRGNRLATVFDETGKQYLPDVLVGLRRTWLYSHASKDYHNRYNNTNNGRKKGVYSNIRHMKTFQERKWSKAWDDVEFAPKTRPARMGYHLPDAWEDLYAHNDKSWKTQSKRKRQWK